MRYLLRAVVERSSRLLRSYDMFGRTGDHEFLLILPGCSAVNANMLAERLRLDVFSARSFALANRFGSPHASASLRARAARPWWSLREAELALHEPQEADLNPSNALFTDPTPEIDPIGFLVIRRAPSSGNWRPTRSASVRLSLLPQVTPGSASNRNS